MQQQHQQQQGNNEKGLNYALHALSRIKRASLFLEERAISRLCNTTHCGGVGGGHTAEAAVIAEEWQIVYTVAKAAADAAAATATAAVALLFTQVLRKRFVSFRNGGLQSPRPLLNYLL